MLAEERAEEDMQPVVGGDVDEDVAVAVQVPDPGRLGVGDGVGSGAEIDRAVEDLDGLGGLEKPASDRGAVAAYGAGEVSQTRLHRQPPRAPSVRF